MRTSALIHLSWVIGIVGSGGSTIAFLGRRIADVKRPPLRRCLDWKRRILLKMVSNL
jgi:hypothetical protein